MLLGQDGGGDQDGDLLAVLARLERRPHRQLGLSVTNVAAQQAVHGAMALHVLLDLFAAGDLVGGGLVGKFGFEFALPFGIGGISSAKFGGAGGLHLQQLGRHIHDGRGDFCLLLFPRPASQPGKLRRSLESADVFLDQVDAGRRHVQRRVLGKAQRQVFLAGSILGDGLHPHEARDAMGDVDDVISLFQIEERIHRPPRDHLLHPPALLITVEQLVMAQQCHRHQIGGTVPRRSRKAPHCGPDFLGLRHPGPQCGPYEISSA